MNAWAERAKVHFLDKCPNPTPKTPKTPLLGVLGVPSRPLCEKTVGTFGGFGGSPLAHPEKTTFSAPPKPVPRFSVYAPWNEADRAYQAHHWQCPQCRVNARTRDREPRCAIGQELYTAYELAAMKGHQ